MGWWEYDEEWFWTFEPFSELTTTFCKYWILIEINVCRKSFPGGVRMTIFTANKGVTARENPGY